MTLPGQSVTHRPVHGGYPAAKPGPLIAVKMSPAAAQSLAQACRLASYRAADELEHESLSAAGRRATEERYDWLSWGGRWLVSEEARR